MMKSALLLLMTTLMLSNLFGQIDLELKLTEDYQPKENSYDRSKYIAADDELFYAVSRKFVEKKDGYSTSGYVALIVGYDIKTLETDFVSELNLPALNAEELLFHGSFPSEDGINIVYSFYDKKNNERVIAIAKMNSSGETSPDVYKLSSTPRNTEYASSEVTLHYQLESETAVIVEKSPIKGAALVATAMLQSEIHTIHLNKDGSIISDNRVQVGEKKKYDMKSVTATDNGSILLRRDGKYDAVTVIIHGPTGNVITLDDPKDDIGKDFFYTEPVELFEKPNGELVSVEVLHSTVKSNSSRIVGFRTAVVDVNGDLKSSFNHKIDKDDTYGAKPNPNKSSFIRGFNLEGVSLSENSVHITGFSLGLFNLGNLNSIALNIESGSYKEERCERYFRPKGSYAARTGKAYALDGKSGFFQEIPVDWMDKDCSNLERITKKSSTRTVALGYQTLSLNGTSMAEPVVFHGDGVPSTLYVNEILNINGKFLGVFERSGNTYFGWLPEL